ncbi:P1 family peptidase [Thermovenabulum gondwanense]|uniref:Putative aminopeptidase n=1 Tax=Thermovenabulum gondwanense TaxID=520767 RepID=A0A162M3R4_9FIRM|nr:P1 family peptidase [Thermovenabulum gondwanense]KYO63796.1 putative aminopeptidase [Thermovenabulum gondwanense]
MKTRENTILEVPGIKVGQVSDLEALTGCTVILCERGAVCGVDVRGGAPGSRETDLLRPENLVDKVHAVFLAGGSAFGLDGASGVMEYLEEKGLGFDVGVTHVPIVPASVLFDLTVGNYKVRPDKGMGYKACEKATDEYVEQGNVGAGTGATVGKILGMKNCMKSGLGTYAKKVGNLVVGAIVAVNALGDVVDPGNGEILAGALKDDLKEFADTLKIMEKLDIQEEGKNVFIGNTTIGVVATNARLTKAEAKKVASMAHNGLAKTIRPCHTMYDGDTIYALSTADLKADINLVGSLACEVMAQAVINAVINARGIGGLKSYNDIKMG